MSNILPKASNAGDIVFHQTCKLNKNTGDTDIYPQTSPQTGRIKKKTKKQLRKGFEERKPLKFLFNLNTGELKPHIGLFIG